MSDSSDIDFSDDDAFFEQKKQEMMAQAHEQKKREVTYQYADPAFQAQFDPKSHSYHGNFDPRAIQLEGGSRLPAELAKQLGTSSIDLNAMPDANDDGGKDGIFSTDYASFGPIYLAVYKTRESSINAKKLFSGLQNVLNNHFKWVEMRQTDQFDLAADFAILTSSQQQIQPHYKQTTQLVLDAVNQVKSSLQQLQTNLTAMTAFDADEVQEQSSNEMRTKVSDFALKYLIKDVQTMLTNISTMVMGTCDDEKMKAKQDLYFKMKKLTGEMTIKQGEMLSVMKVLKKGFLMRSRK